MDDLHILYSVLADMYDIFGDGTDYDWALFEEEVGYHHHIRPLCVHA